MLRIIAAVFAIALSCELKASIVSFPCSGSVIVLADSATGARLNLQPDAYTNAHTSFDLQIRLDKASGLSEQDYLNAAARNVRNWPAAEQAQLRAAFQSIDSAANAGGYKLRLPDTVFMIKTAGGEEFGAEGYTRANRIMLNTGAQSISLHLVAHELWHVISRLNPKMRDAAYAVFNFRPCNNIDYKPALHNKVITNPDCPFLMHCITLTVGGKPQDAALLLYSRSDYQPGYGMDKYVNVGLLALAGDDAHKTVLMKGGKPLILELNEPSDLYAKIGTNTPYLLHIEEVTAEHFAAIITGDALREPKYADGLKAVITR